MALDLDIRGALQTRLATVAGIPAIAHEGQRFAPVPGTPFVPCKVVWVSGRPSTLGDGHLVAHNGTFEVAAVYPAETATGDAETLASAIKNHFKASDVLTLDGSDIKVRIRHAERLPAMEDGDWIRVPVSIAWYLFATDY